MKAVYTMLWLWDCKIASFNAIWVEVVFQIELDPSEKETPRVFNIGNVCLRLLQLADYFFNSSCGLCCGLHGFLQIHKSG